MRMTISALLVFMVFSSAAVAAQVKVPIHGRNTVIISEGTVLSGTGIDGRKIENRTGTIKIVVKAKK